ncbi:hypothetical protein SNEBB_002673 [Seison nebaliae]|nr:hypothetical protein SNEBB_002673 [Seison nebaliae]
MGKKKCERCGEDVAKILRPVTRAVLCAQCFFEEFETEIHRTIVDGKMFERNDIVAIGASGGKDSTVLAYVMKLLNDKYDYGLNLHLLSIDEGIKGYRDDSLETVKQNQIDYDLPLTILSYKDVFGWTMDEIVKLMGNRNNCTYCGTFRRQALNRGAKIIGATKIVTGHNADDIAETILMNMQRGNAIQLERCVSLVTGSKNNLPRSKPFKYTYEKEIVMYAHLRRLLYFTTECIYSPLAFRGYVRSLIKQMEMFDPKSIINIIHSAEQLSFANHQTNQRTLSSCERCGEFTSQSICQACLLIDRLEKQSNSKNIEKLNKFKF